MTLLEFTKIIIENENVLFHICASNYYEQGFLLEFNKGFCKYIRHYPYKYGIICPQYTYYNYLIQRRFMLSKLNDKEYIINFYEYTYLDVAAKIIWRYWKKCKYNVFKKRRDSLKKELMEYFWHPSRIKFDL